MEKRTCELIRQHWPAIVRVAKALSEHKELDRDQLMEILNGANKLAAPANSVRSRRSNSLASGMPQRGRPPSDPSRVLCSPPAHLFGG